MYKRVINYVDFDGNKCSDEYHFNYTKSELTQLSFSKDGGIASFAEKAVRDRNGRNLCDLYETLILGAVGERRNEGKNFVKNDEIRENFKSSMAYETLFEELIESPDKFAEFFNAVIPSDMKITGEQLNQAITDAKTRVGMN